MSRFPNPLPPLAQRLPLRMTLVVPFVVQILAAVSLVGYLSFQNGQAAVNTLVFQLQREVARRVEDRLRDFLAVPHKINEINAQKISLGQLDLTDGRQLEQEFWQQSQLFPSTSYIYIGTAAGMFHGAEQVEGGRPRVAEWEAASDQKEFKTYATNIAGDRVTLLSIVPNYDLFSRSWYQAADFSKRPTWGEIYLWSAPYPNVVLPAVRALYAETGELLGVLGVDLSLFSLSNFLGTLQVGRSGEVFIMERNGLLVASSVKDTPLQETAQGRTRLPADQSNSLLIRDTVDFLEARFRSFNLISREQRLNFQRDRQGHWVQVTPYRDRYGLDWLIVVVIPESDFMAQIHQNRRTTLQLCLLALAIATGLGILTARRISRPILRLNQAARDIAAGQLDQDVHVTGIRELLDLAGSFNSMAQQLRKSFATLAAQNADLEQARAALATINEQLEDKVQERTAQLSQANTEIAALNERLKAENLRMSAELSIAKQLQEVVLPRDRELQSIEGLDIASFMEPAEEIGGDYYDVLPTNTGARIGIGDVTGHGLESGILMLMVQTAVRALHEGQITDTVQLLDILNGAIYKNPQRMNASKSMSLALLDYHQGQLAVTGQHEEIVIARASGAIERVDTVDLGLPVGLDYEIKEFIASSQVQLQLGDAVILYTDGITEAENSSGLLYGIDRLCAVVQTHQQGSATAIRDAVIADVRRHIGSQKLLDDITLLVLKRYAIDGSASECPEGSSHVGDSPSPYLGEGAGG